MSKDAESYATTPSLRRYLLEAEFLEDGTVQQIRGLGSEKTPQTWKKAKSLGTGSFGQVRQERRKDETGDWHYRAVKVCARADLERARVDFTRELSALAAFSSSKYSGLFVNLVGWWMDSRNLYIATEYVGRGDLSHYINETLQENDAKEIMEGTLNGLQIMHQNGFTHRDIKPQNLLVVQKPPEFQRWWVKIADFGISKKIHEDQSTLLHTALGTRPYCAPEILELLPSQETSVYSNKVDIWSLGCVLFNITSHGHETFTVSELMKYCHGLLPFNPRKRKLSLGSEGETLLRDFLNPTPELRPSAADALKHEWFKSELDLLTEDTRMPQHSTVEKSNETISQHPTAEISNESSHQRNYNSFLETTITDREEPSHERRKISFPSWWSPDPKPPDSEVEQASDEDATSNGRLVLKTPAQLDSSTSEQEPLVKGPLRTFEGHEDTVQAVAFSPDGTLVASASYDRTVRVWHAETGEVRTLKGHTGGVETVAFSPVGRRLASGSKNARIIFWDGITKEVEFKLGYYAEQVAFSPDGRLLAVPYRNAVVLWDADTREQRTTIKGRTKENVLCLAFSPDGKGILFGAHVGTVVLCDVATGEIQRIFQDENHSIFAVAMSPNGKLALSASGARLKIWDIESGQARTFGPAERWVYAADFSPDGRLIACSGPRGEAELWDVATGKLRYILKGHRTHVKSVRFSPDGRVLVSASYDRTVKLWEVPSELQLTTTNGEQDRRTIRKPTNDAVHPTTTSQTKTER